MREKRVTQQYIANVLGLDVSSVNKILNGKRGHTFRGTTIQAVKSTARRFGYKLRTGASKVELVKALRGTLAFRDIMPDRQFNQIADLIERSGF